MEINCETDGEQNCDFEESEMTDKRTEMKGDNKKYRCLHMQVKKGGKEKEEQVLIHFRTSMHVYIFAWIHAQLFAHKIMCVC